MNLGGRTFEMLSQGTTKPSRHYVQLYSVGCNRSSKSTLLACRRLGAVRSPSAHSALHPEPSVATFPLLLLGVIAVNSVHERELAVWVYLSGLSHLA